jgi:hypothetical protein
MAENTQLQTTDAGGDTLPAEVVKELPFCKGHPLINMRIKVQTPLKGKRYVDLTDEQVELIAGYVGDGSTKGQRCAGLVAAFQMALRLGDPKTAMSVIESMKREMMSKRKRKLQAGKDSAINQHLTLNFPTAESIGPVVDLTDVRQHMRDAKGAATAPGLPQLTRGEVGDEPKGEEDGDI